MSDDIPPPPPEEDFPEDAQKHIRLPSEAPPSRPPPPRPTTTTSFTSLPSSTSLTSQSGLSLPVPLAKPRSTSSHSTKIRSMDDDDDDEEEDEEEVINNDDYDENVDEPSKTYMQQSRGFLLSDGDEEDGSRRAERKTLVSGMKTIDVEEEEHANSSQATLSRKPKSGDPFPAESTEFSAILADATGVEFLRKHLALEYSTENYEFYITVRDIVNDRVEALQWEKIKEAANVYVKDSGTQSVNIKSERRVAVLNAIAQNNLQASLAALQSCQQEVVDLMGADSYKRFREGPLWKQMNLQIRRNRGEMVDDPSNSKVVFYWEDSPFRQYALKFFSLKKKYLAMPVDKMPWTKIIGQSKNIITHPLHKDFYTAERKLLAIQLNKGVLGFMRFRTTTQPDFHHLNDLVRAGLEKPWMRDELYAQVVKQTCTAVDGEKRTARAWQLFSLFAGFFPPSHRLAPTLLTHLDVSYKDPVHSKSSKAIAACKETLLHTLSVGPRERLPSPEELGMFLNLKTASVKVNFVDGSSKRYPLQSQTTAAELLAQVLKKYKEGVPTLNGECAFGLYEVAKEEEGEGSSHAKDYLQFKTGGSEGKAVGGVGSEKGRAHLRSIKPNTRVLDLVSSWADSEECTRRVAQWKTEREGVDFQLPDHDVFNHEEEHENSENDRTSGGSISAGVMGGIGAISAIGMASMASIGGVNGPDIHFELLVRPKLFHSSFLTKEKLSPALLDVFYLQAMRDVFDEKYPAIQDQMARLAALHCIADGVSHTQPSSIIERARLYMPYIRQESTLPLSASGTALGALAAATASPNSSISVSPPNSPPLSPQNSLTVSSPTGAGGGGSNMFAVQNLATVPGTGLGTKEHTKYYFQTMPSRQFRAAPVPPSKVVRIDVLSHSEGIGNITLKCASSTTVESLRDEVFQKIVKKIGADGAYKQASDYRIARNHEGIVITLPESSLALDAFDDTELAQKDVTAFLTLSIVDSRHLVGIAPTERNPKQIAALVWLHSLSIPPSTTPTEAKWLYVDYIKKWPHYGIQEFRCMCLFDVLASDWEWDGDELKNLFHNSNTLSKPLICNIGVSERNLLYLDPISKAVLRSDSLDRSHFLKHRLDTKNDTLLYLKKTNEDELRVVVFKSPKCKEISRLIDIYQGW